MKEYRVVKDESTEPQTTPPSVTSGNSKYIFYNVS